MILFGSRAVGDHRPDSDYDVFLTEEEVAENIEPNMLIVNGGKLDAFYYPNDDGWAEPVGDDSGRMLRVWDDHGYPYIDERELTYQEAASVLRAVYA